MVPPGPGSAEAALQRVMVLVCMRPRSTATPAALENRRRAYAEGIGAGTNPTGEIDVDGRKATLFESGRWDNHGKFRRLEPVSLTSQLMKVTATGLKPMRYNSTSTP